MLYKCNSIKNIEELKFFDAKEKNNFSYMFNGCELLSNILFALYSLFLVLLINLLNLFQYY